MVIKVIRNHYLDFCNSVTSSYSPSLPVRTPSKYSLIDWGSAKDDGFVFSRLLSIRGKKPRDGRVGELDFASQIWQYQGSSRASASELRGGSQHVKWKERSHPSQHSRKPLPLQAEQKSWLLDCNKSANVYLPPEVYGKWRSVAIIQYCRSFSGTTTWNFSGKEFDNCKIGNWVSIYLIRPFWAGRAAPPFTSLRLSGNASNYTNSFLQRSATEKKHAVSTVSTSLQYSLWCT